jgi:hypothetical protein
MAGENIRCDPKETCPEVQSAEYDWSFGTYGREETFAEGQAVADPGAASA